MYKVQFETSSKASKDGYYLYDCKGKFNITMKPFMDTLKEYTINSNVYSYPEFCNKLDATLNGHDEDYTNKSPLYLLKEKYAEDGYELYQLLYKLPYPHELIIALVTYNTADNFSGSIIINNQLTGQDSYPSYGPNAVYNGYDFYKRTSQLVRLVNYECYMIMSYMQNKISSKL